MLAANRGSHCSLTRAMDGRIVRCGVISSCQSAATFEIVKRFWALTHIRSAITSIATFTFIFCEDPQSLTATVEIGRPPGLIGVQPPPSGQTMSAAPSDLCTSQHAAKRPHKAEVVSEFRKQILHGFSKTYHGDNVCQNSQNTFKFVKFKVIQRKLWDIFSPDMMYR